MPDKEPAFYPINLVLMGHLIFQIGSLALLPIWTLTFTVVTVSTAWGYCEAGSFAPLVRAGTVVHTIAFVYILVEEVWHMTPRNMAEELEGDVRFYRLENRPESTAPLAKYRAVAVWTNRVHRPLVRLLELFLVLLGSLLSGFGDIVGTWFF